MNIYQKVAAARVRFQDQGVKMSGKNTFAGYTYFELSDILPAINRLGQELGFLCRVSFTDTLATMDIVNMDDPKEVAQFTSPLSTAALKGCHEVQNLGAVETYIKRYLYQNAFEIVECDALNGTQGKPEPKAESSREYIDLKAALIDYLNAGMFDHPENVEKVIDAKDLTNMRKALDAAKAKEKAAQKKVGE